MEGQAQGETYLIDGYNLILRAFPLGPGEDMRAARENLEVRLREFQRSLGAGTRVILVYDGAEGMASAAAGHPTRRDPDFEVIYSLPPASADEVIVEECRRREGREQLVVVTSDLKDIASSITGMRLRHRTSEDFSERLDEAMRDRSGSHGETARPAKPAPEKPSPEEIPPGEVDEWLRIFSQPLPRRPGQGGRRPGPRGGGPGR